MSQFGALRICWLLASAMFLIVSACAVVLEPGAAGAAVPPAPLQITGASLPGVTTGQPYSVQLQATGGTQPYDWIVLDQLPPGLSLSAAGLISGTAGSPPVNLATTYTFRVNVTDANGNQNLASFSIVLTPVGLVTPPAPLQITTTSIPEVNFNTAYSFQMQATGGTTPYYWSSPNLPQGFTMSESGVLSGSNPLPEQATITVQVYDSGFGYSNGGVNSTVPGQQHALKNYTFTVTSGYPQFDPTFFQLSAALAPYSPTAIEAQLEALVVAEVDSLVGNADGIVTGLIGDTNQSLANEACGLWYQTNVDAYFPNLGPGVCPFGGL